MEQNKPLSAGPNPAALTLMKHITIHPSNNRFYCYIDGVPAGPMYDVFDRGMLKHFWPYKAGNNGHEIIEEAVAHAQKLCDYFNEVYAGRDKLIPAAAGKNASARFWGGATFETDGNETGNLEAKE